MSFILDALRRAESQRGTQPPRVTTDNALGVIADKPSSFPSLQWIALAVIATSALIFAAMNFLRPNDVPPQRASAEQTAPAQSTTPVFPTINANTPLADVAEPGTRQVRPLVREARPAVETVPPVVAAEKPVRRVTPGSVSYSKERLTDDTTQTRTFTNLPAGEDALQSYTDAAISGRDQLPIFHLDIHVYATEPQRRFVFVNNRKYREGEQLDEGGTVERITPQGVVLNHRGRRFELFPD